MLSVLVNVLAILLGSAVGLLLKKGIPPRVSSSAMVALGLCTLYIGIDGALQGSNTILLILSLVFGTIIGTALDLDGKLTRIGNFMERKFRRKNDKVSIAEGFVTSSLLFCVGAMTIVGSLNAGLKGDYSLIYTKSILDLISSCMLAGTLGLGVPLSAVFVLVCQGGLVLLSGLLSGVLSDPVIAELTCAGSVMIMGLGINMLEIKKIKVANMLPALLLVPLFYFLLQYLPI